MIKELLKDIGVILLIIIFVGFFFWYVKTADAADWYSNMGTIGSNVGRINIGLPAGSFLQSVAEEINFPTTNEVCSITIPYLGYRNNPTDAVKISIYSASSTPTGGTLLASGNITTSSMGVYLTDGSGIDPIGSNFSGATSTAKVSFNPCITFTSSTQYYIVQERTGSYDATNYFASLWNTGTASNGDLPTNATGWWNWDLAGGWYLANGNGLRDAIMVISDVGQPTSSITLSTPSTSTQDINWNITGYNASSTAKTGTLSVNFWQTAQGIDAINHDRKYNTSFASGTQALTVPKSQLYANTQYTAFASFVDYATGNSINSSYITFTMGAPFVSSTAAASLLANPLSWTPTSTLEFTGTSTTNFATGTPTSTYDVLGAPFMFCPVSFFGYDVFDICGSFQKIWWNLTRLDSPLLMAQINILLENMKNAFPLNWIVGIYNDFNLTDPYTSSNRPDFNVSIKLPGDPSGQETKLFSLASTTHWLNYGTDEATTTASSQNVETIRAFFVAADWLALAFWFIMKMNVKLNIHS